MKASTGLRRLPELALRRRRQGLAKLLPPVTEILRGFTGRAICDLRKPGLQMCQGRTAWADLVSDRYSGTRPHYGRHHLRGESGGSPRLDRELPQGERSPRKDFRDQSGTAAARARQAAQAQTK